MLHEFITTYRDAIITRTREKLTDRPWPLVSTSELEHGVPLFLSQLSETLRWETTPTPFSQNTIGASAVKHGRELRALGFNISQVVHDYGDICQAITEVAVEQNVPITTEEFHTLNRCLDTAIAEAVTEHARITSESRSSEEIERSGRLAHEIRDMLNTALLAFHALKLGTVAVNGSTGTVLGRSLMSLRDLVDNTLSDVRMAANIQRSERVPVAAFLSEIAVVANLHAESRALQFVLEQVNPQLAVDADPQLLASAVMNLLNNAFKYTHAGGRVMLRALCDDGRVRIEIEDECGGIPGGTVDPFKTFADRRTNDRAGLGLGLSIARKAVRMHGGGHPCSQPAWEGLRVCHRDALGCRRHARFRRRRLIAREESPDMSNSHDGSPEAPPPHAQLVQMAMGHWVSRIVYVAAKLDLAGRLANGPKTADDLAGPTGTDATALYRFMRSLATLGILSESDSRQFSLTPLGEALKADAPGAARSSVLTIASDWWVRGFGELMYSLQTGKSGFEKALGQPIFDYLARNPEDASLFSETMIGFHGAEPPAVAEAYDFSDVGTLVDVGGASGHLLTTILQRYPKTRGILFDLPHVVRDAPALIGARGLTDRVEIQSGSFFDTVPAGADVYLLSHIIHDWREDLCLTILGHCRRAMNPGGRVLIIEMVLPPADTPHPGKMLDVMMLVGPGGQERTAQEYDALLGKAGFRLRRTVPTASAVSVVEAFVA